MKDIGYIIKTRRKALHMSKNELAEKSGVSRATILFVEREGRQPMFSHAVALLNALGLELSIHDKEKRA